jgi:anaerobic selenocysteine-containing dehydrogenase
LQKLEFFGVVDFFMSETAHYADVVLAGSLQEEEEGIGCTAEGRVIHIQKAVDPPGNAKGDSWIYCELAKRLGKAKYFPYQSTREIYEELREASRDGLTGLWNHKAILEILSRELLLAERESRRARTLWADGKPRTTFKRRSYFPPPRGFAFRPTS